MKSTLLGFGAMRLPTDVNECKKMFSAYLESGGNYFDTAYVYGGSEEMLKKALTTEHPRDSYLIANKIPPWSVNSIKDCDRLLGESLKRTGLDYFDNYLLHSLDDGNEKKADSVGMYKWIADTKKKGTVRNIGFSFHGDQKLLEKILTEHPEMDFVMLQLNYADILRGPAEAFHKTALKHNKTLYVMEPVKGGTLANLPKPAEAMLKEARPDATIASWALRFAGSLEKVQTVLSGMSSLAQVQDNIKTFDNFEPMTTSEYALLERVLGILGKEGNIPCTGCRYCIDVCPKKIAIDKCISLYNDVHRDSDSKWNRSLMYHALPSGSMAKDCIGCGVCLSLCPQNINIPDALKIVAEEFA